jgi:predicted amino acid-binding ACT domain protein
MKDFGVRLTHRPGELARVATMLARYGVNLKAVSALAIDGQATVHILPDEAEPARAALEKNSIPFEESDVVTVLLENRAGELANLSGKLSDAGVNLRAIYVTGVVDNLVELAVVSDNPDRTRAAVE